MLHEQLTLTQRILVIFASISILLLCWYVVLWLGMVPEILFPSPHRVLHALLTLGKSSGFWHDLASTIFSWFFGVLIGVFLGGFFGLFFGINRLIWLIIEPWIEFLRSLPSIVLIPMVSLFLGVGGSSRLACSTIVVSTLLISTAGTAIRSASKTYLRLATAWRISNWEKIRYFYFPSAVTHMVVSLKAALPIALIVTIASDMLIATDSGIGKILMDSSAVFDISTMYAVVIVIGFLGYFAAIAGSWLENRFIHWSGK